MELSARSSPDGLSKAKKMLILDVEMLSEEEKLKRQEELMKKKF